MTDYMHLDAKQVEQEIDALLAGFPELAEDEDLRADILEGETGLHEVLSRIVQRAQEAADMASAINARRQALSARESGCKRREEAMRKLAHRLMDRARVRKVTLPEATLSVRAVPPGVQIFDEDVLPDKWWRVKREIDTAKLKDALKGGASIPGACLSNSSETLSIRT